MRLFSDSASMIGDPYLARAYELALQGVGRTAPNPRVGCVISADGRIVGEGFHPGAGEPHAEVFALLEAGARARGGTAYVTLEPCRHHGRTPPCTEALIEAGIAEVVVGLPDPSPEARGGAERLREAGVGVRFAETSAPFAELNEGWMNRVRSGRPFVTVKVGASMDGRVALARGTRSSITGGSGYSVTSRLRAAADAVVVGCATATVDDPALTVRDDDGVHDERQPLRVVLARGEAPCPNLGVFTDGAAPVLVLAPTGSVAASGPVPDGSKRLEYDAEGGLLAAFEALGTQGLNDVLVEPGPRLFAALWESGLTDRVITVTAGGMAGPDGVEMFAGRPDADGNELDHVLCPEEAGIVGDVAVVSWRPAARSDEMEGTACSRDW